MLTLISFLKRRISKVTNFSQIFLIIFSKTLFATIIVVCVPTPPQQIGIEYTPEPSRYTLDNFAQNLSLKRTEVVFEEFTKNKI